MTPLLLGLTIQWTPVWITTYADKYHGRTSRDGSRFSQRAMTCAVPRSQWKRLKGKDLTFRFRGRTVTCRVTDSCGWIKGKEVRNYDLSRMAWTKLTRSAPSRVRAEVEVEGL